jgi:O-antigen/teichoic acid export membrane protein
MLIVSIIIARYLGKESFGQYSLIRNTISTFEIYTNFGLAPTATKSISENKLNDNLILSNTIKSIFFITIVVTLILSLFIYATSDVISLNYFKDESLSLMLKCGILILIGSSILSITSGILVGFEIYKSILKTTIYSSLVSLPIFLYLILQYKLIGSLIAIGIYFLLDSLFKFLYIKKHLLDYNIHCIKKETIYSILKFSFPLFLSALFMLPAIWYSKILLLKLGFTYLDIASFEASFQWLTIIIIITGAVTNVSLPIFSTMFINSTRKELKKALILNLSINLLISLLMTIIIIFMAKYIMMLYGNDFSDDNILLIILTISSIFMSLIGVLNKFLISINKRWYILLISIIWTIVFLIYCFILIPENGAKGLAYAYLYSYIVTFFLYLVSVYYLNNKERLI